MIISLNATRIGWVRFTATSGCRSAWSSRVRIMRRSVPPTPAISSMEPITSLGLIICVTTWPSALKTASSVHWILQWLTRSTQSWLMRRAHHSLSRDPRKTVVNFIPESTKSFRSSSVRPPLRDPMMARRRKKAPGTSASTKRPVRYH